MKSIKPKKQMEYEDAPSGYVTLYNYKEPFMKFENGHGFQGVLLFDGASESIQCHLCGKWFHSLPTHIFKVHGMIASEYKETVGLRQTTALISEKIREKLITTGRERFKNIRPGVKMSQETKDKIRETLKKRTREFENERGTCPEQLVDRLQRKYKELGRTPSEAEFAANQTVNAVWGSFKNLCEVAEVPYRKPGSNITKAFDVMYDKHMNAFKEFVRKHNRLPEYRDKEMRTSQHWINQKLDKKQKEQFKISALMADDVYRKTSEILHFSNDQLLILLKAFKAIHKREPSLSDCKRGLLPPASQYYRRFGNWKEAIKQI